MTDHQHDFEATMRGLSKGLRVEEIASFGMEKCQIQDDPGATISQMSEMGLDQIPVIEGGDIVGVLDVFDLRDGPTLKRRMTPLSEAMLVSSSDPIGTLLPILRTSQYRLVVHHGRIEGIVTRSDLIKLPVRLFAFAQITYLEMLMAQRIVGAFQNSDRWLTLLKTPRQEKVSEKIEKYRDERLDPSPLEFTDFCDKRDILGKHYSLGERFDKDLKQVERLRDLIAHAGDYGQTLKSLQTFMDRLQATEKWINKLQTIEETKSTANGLDSQTTGPSATVVPPLTSPRETTSDR